MRWCGAALCLLLVGCSGDLTDPCAAVTCAPGRVCVAGSCVTPEGGGGPVDLGPGLEGTQPGDRALADSAAGDSAADDGAADAATDVQAVDSSNCPDPSTAAGSYSGTFVDGAGGGLAKGNLSFKLTASGATTMKLDGSLTGTALPGVGNYKITGKFSGSVSCATITTKLSGSIDGYGFTGAFNGTLKGTTASGLWFGQQAGGGLSLAGIWSAKKN